MKKPTNVNIIDKTHELICSSELSAGDYFWFLGGLHLKIEEKNAAIDLESGEKLMLRETDSVTLVNKIEIRAY